MVEEVSIASQEVTLAGGASDTVTFQTEQEFVGTYTVNVDDLSGTFTVREPPVIASSTNWGVTSGIIAGFIIIGAATWIVARRRKACQS